VAFTVKGEYERLMKIKEEREKKSKDKCLAFECGCACGYVTRIEYLPFRYDEEIHRWIDEEIHIYAIAGWDNYEKLVLILTENDVSKRYQDRKYYYWKEYGILESFEN
jgi:hypothetical protein